MRCDPGLSTLAHVGGRECREYRECVNDVIRAYLFAFAFTTFTTFTVVAAFTAF